MTSCTIIISHYNSLPFLDACIRQIKKYAHPDIYQRIIIVDQSHQDIKDHFGYALMQEWGADIISTLPLYSGYGLDYVLRNINIGTSYVCQLHVDAFPIHQNWLYLPITLIEENKFSFVGQLQFINDKNNLAYIYPPSAFFAMAQCYNVAKTQTYRELSYEAGFTRFHNRPQSGLTFLNDDWAKWAEDDYEHKGSDDDVVAFHWNGKYKTDDMLGLSVTGFIAPHFGRIIENILFHFGSCRESKGVEQAMGEQYNNFTKRINENYSDELIDEMLALAKKNKPNGNEILSRNFWNGTLKKSSPTSEVLNKRIEELKK